MDKLGTYDVIVIGAGHAGIEAAHAAAKLGARTAVFTLSLDFIGNMPCNPSIGGTARGHLVREVDALGGLMGIAADATYLQSRMLNRGKGPAVHSLRVQTDRKRYHIWMKHALEKTANLDIHQGEIVGVDVQDGKVCGVYTNLHGYYGCKAVVVATGTNLGGENYQYLGNLNAGTEGSVDFDITPDAAGNISGVITLNYEDASGNPRTISKNFTATAEEMNYDDYMPDPDSSMDEPQQTGMPVWGWVPRLYYCLLVHWDRKSRARPCGCRLYSSYAAEEERGVDSGVWCGGI